MNAEVLRVCAYTALAAFSAHHWFMLVEGSDAWRWVVCAALGAAGAVALILLRSQRREVALAGSALVTIAMLGGGLAAIGIPLELLMPGAWDELSAELGQGLQGVSQIDTPYSGADPWTRLGILAAAPPAIALGMLGAFWPGHAVKLARFFGLALLIALYGVSVTWEAPSQELARGALLFVVVAAVLWLPRARLPRAAAALASLLVAALVALPLAARVDAADPLIGYTNWKVFGDGQRISFNWNHTYGELDWPQEGTEVFVATTDRPAYWKTYVLDEFENASWSRANDGFGEVGLDYDLAGAPADLVEEHPEWVRRFEIELTTLRSRLAVTSGSRASVEGIEIGNLSGDGTTTAERFEIESGSEYTVTSYVPEPTSRQLRRARGAHPAGAERYTRLLIPQPLTPPGGGVPAPTGVAVAPPTGVDRSPVEREAQRDLRFEEGESVESVVKGTPYERVLELTRRLTAGARTDFAAVARIQRFLISSYRYDQDVPLRQEPLPAFLFRDRAGYCQQFSGAMALMLRMEGIPSRVVAGFAPGVPQAGGTYSVSDTDAHSWVEVLYPGIGWVTVDPTPGETPAHTNVVVPGSERGTSRLEELALGRAFANEETPRGGLRGARQGVESSGDDESGSPIPVLAFLAFAGGVTTVFTRRRRRLRSPAGAALQLRELQEALTATGFEAGRGATLLAIQHRLSSIGPEAARYAAGLRESRYGPRRRGRPGPAERRSFRWALARHSGPMGWWKALRAIPPGGPKA